MGDAQRDAWREHGDCVGESERVMIVDGYLKDPIVVYILLRDLDVMTVKAPEFEVVPECCRVRMAAMRQRSLSAGTLERLEPDCPIS